jgi:aryl-alcohol dehydrogenase-like predicted oxidoreductase
MKMKLSRRSFVALSTLLPASLLLPRRAAAGEPATRILGRTKLKVSEVSMGVMLTKDSDIVRAALDAGITYFDTARAYMGGRNEEILGRGLKGRRQEAIIATKCHRFGSRKRIVASVEKSLKALGTDYIDVLQLHNLSSGRDVLHDGNLEGLAAVKKSGKVRFVGVTSHNNMVEVMDAAVEAGDYDTVLTSFNFLSPHGVADAIGRAAGAGLGVIAMKTMSGGYRGDTYPGLNPFQAALRWVLRHPGVTTTIPSMATFEQLKQNVAVLSTAGSIRDDIALKNYAAVAGPRYCRACLSCLPQCPLGADVPTAMRGVMYDEGYGRPAMARETVVGAALPCGGCVTCAVTCPNGLDVPQRIAAALSLTAGPPPSGEEIA